MEDTITIRATRTFGLMFRGQLAIHRWLPGQLMFTAASLVVPPLLIAGSTGMSWFATVTFIVVYVAALSSLMLLRSAHIARRSVRRAVERGDPVIALSSTGMRCDDGDISIDIAWAAIHRVCFSSEMIFVFTTPSLAVFIPRASVPTEAQASVIRIVRDAGVRLQGT